jgi:hypothetical protein
MRHVTDADRRHRLARRHALAAGHRLADVEAVTRALTVLHATEPATVHLAVAARTEGVGVADVERALYDDRTLVKQLAMRRTLFVFPRDLLPAAWGSASARVAGTEWKRVVRDVTAAGLTDDGDAWLKTACDAVLARLGAESGDDGLPAQRLREEVPEIAGTVTISPGTTWGGDVPIAPRVMTQLGCRGEIVRGRNAGHWRTSRPAWTLMSRWLGAVPAPLEEAEGYAELVRRWLGSFGPGTEDDLVWWLGATKSAVRRALTAVGAVPVSLDGGATGWVLPGDDEAVDPVPPWAALLPVLDPTVMGWKDRTFFLGDAGPRLFDRNGNAGTTAWWDGRVVGCWVQDDDGRVVVVPLEPLPDEATAALGAEADRLTRWLDGARIGTVYPSPLMKSTRVKSTLVKSTLAK